MASTLPQPASRRGGTDAPNEPVEAPPASIAHGILTPVLEHERARWFLWSPVAFAAGAGGYFALPVEPALATALLGLAAAAVLRMLAAGSATPVVVLLNIALLAAFGFAAAKARTEMAREPVLAAETGEIEARGFVELVEPRASGGARMTLRVTSLGDLPAGARPLRIRVTSRVPLGDIRQGDPVSAWVKLLPPAGPAAPGDYDFARYAYFKGIGAVGYVTRPPTRADIGHDPPFDVSVTSGIGVVRHHIAARVAAVLDGQTGAIATALITGERGAIDDATNDAYRASGLYHVLSISGLHMAIMGGAVFFAVRFLLAILPAIALRADIKKWAAVAALAGSLGYLAISGGAFATVRSFLMIAVMFVAILFDRPALALRNVALAALLILVAFPESVLDPGFQMSFAAVIALVAGYGAFERTTAGFLDGERGWLLSACGFVAAIVMSTLFASLAVAPLALYHFHQSQHFAVIANALAMPVCNLVVMPMALASLVAIPFGLERVPLAIMGYGIDAMSATAHWVAALPVSTGTYPAFSPLAIVLVAGGGLLLALCRHRTRFAGLLLAAAGGALAVTPDRPDLIVSADANVVALRQDSGALAMTAARWDGFTIERWLERDGDARPVAAMRNNGGYHCDALGCVGTTKGRRVAVSNEPEGLEIDCALADVLVVRYAAAPRACGSKRHDGGPLVIDRDLLRATGAVELYLASHTAPHFDHGAEAAVKPAGPAERTSEPITPPPIAPVHEADAVQALSDASHHGSRAPSKPARRHLPAFVSRIETVASWQGQRPWSATSR